MKKILVLMVVLLIAFNLYAQNTTEAGVSGSPYLMIIKEIPTKTDVELTKTDVDVNVSGVIADVTVRQYYRSVSDQVLEAVYVFPASVHAAVYSMKMKIGSREIVAVIKEKGQARKDYEQAKLEGKRASLLVQDRPNLFTMNLANIAPGDLIEIEMKYTEMLVPDDKIYTFSFPNIIIPRYGNGSSTDNTIASNSFDASLLKNSAFDIRFNLISPVPIDGIECITHEVNYGGETANHSQITLKDSEKNSAPKDFVVKYKLASDLINSGLLLSKGEGKNAENFFLLTVQPPKRIDPAYIPPREYIFVLDVSGSMDCFPSVIAKKTIYNLLDKLKTDDKFNVILFASGFDVFSENLVTATSENIESAFKFMAESRQGGGTELLPALETALKMPKNSKASRSIVVITDGLIDFESKAFKLIRDNLNKSNVFTFGIGTQMNKLTIEGMAKAGMGLSFELDRVEDAEYQSERFVKYISTPILADIKVTYDGFGVSKVEPTSVPDLFPDRPIVIYGKWDGNLQGGIKIEAINGQEKIFVDLPVKKFGEMVQGDALKQLWARKQIELLSDYQSFGEEGKYQKEITDLGLKYNLMTAYTSFIAVDNEVVPKMYKTAEEIRMVSSPITEKADDQVMYKLDLSAVDQSSGSGFSKRAASSSGNGPDPNLAIDLNYSEPTLLDKIHRFFSYNLGNREIKYNKIEFKKNLKIAQKEMKSYEEGHSSLEVFVNKKGKVTKINHILRHNLNYLDSNQIELDKIAINVLSKTKFNPAIRDFKKVDGVIYIDFNLDKPDYDFAIEFQSKTYLAKNKNDNNSDYWVATLESGSGKKIKFLDKVTLEYTIYNNKQEKVISGSYSTVYGIGANYELIDGILKDMLVGEEKLLYVRKYNIYCQIFPADFGIVLDGNKYIKIKVLEINPK
ncbi:MAG: VIT domain-containing protein [bacterium]